MPRWAGQGLPAPRHRHPQPLNKSGQPRGLSRPSLAKRGGRELRRAPTPGPVLAQPRRLLARSPGSWWCWENRGTAGWAVSGSPQQDAGTPEQMPLNQAQAPLLLLGSVSTSGRPRSCPHPPHSQAARTQMTVRGSQTHAPGGRAAQVTGEAAEGHRSWLSLAPHSGAESGGGQPGSPPPHLWDAGE